MSRDEMHDLIMGMALVALAYAVYAHHKSVINAVPAFRVPTSGEINDSDQAAIATAIGTAPSDGPAIDIPAPIAIGGGGAGGYTFDLNTLLQGSY